MAEDIIYKDGDIVWVKWGNHWWPGEVTGVERQPEGFTKHLKRKPFCVVKFFNEDTYECIHNPKKILPYQCLKKEEFIQKGYSLLKNKNKYMEKFPADVAIAEQLICRKNQVIINTQPDSIVKVILGQPLVHDTSSKSKNYSSRNTEQNTTKRDSVTQILDLTPKCDIHEVENVPSVSTSKDAITIHSESVAKNIGERNIYRCNLCGFKSFRQNVVILHRKMHSGRSLLTTPNTTCSGITKSADIISDHEIDNQENKLPNKYAKFVVEDTELSNHQLSDAENNISNENVDREKDSQNTEEVNISTMNCFTSKEKESITLSTPFKSSESEQSTATCQIPKDNELVSLALCETENELIDLEDTVLLDNVNSQMIQDNFSESSPNLLSSVPMPKRDGEQIRKILLADWSDEEDATIEATNEVEHSIKKINAKLDDSPNTIFPSTSAMTPKGTVDTKTSGRIRNIPKKDRRDIVLQDFNNDIIEYNINISSHNVQENDTLINSPVADVDGRSNASDSSLVEIIEDQQYASVIEIPDDENYINDDNIGNKQKKNEQVVNTSGVSCFDFQEDDVTEDNVQFNASTTAKKVVEHLEQTDLSTSNEKTTTALNIKPEALLKFDENDVYVKDLPIKERSKRIFKSRNLANAVELNVNSTTPLSRENRLSRSYNEDNDKEKHGLEMVNNNEQKGGKLSKGKIEILENVSLDMPADNIILNTKHINERNSNSSQNCNGKNGSEQILEKNIQTENHVLKITEFRKDSIDNIHTNKTSEINKQNFINGEHKEELSVINNELQDYLITETPTDKNSSLAASDTDVEFGLPTSTLNKEYISKFQHNISPSSSTHEAECSFKKLDENLHEYDIKRDSHVFLKTIQERKIVALCKESFKDKRCHIMQKQGEPLTSYITRRYTLDKMTELHTSLLFSKTDLIKKTSISLDNLEQMNNIIEMSSFELSKYSRNSTLVKCDSENVDVDVDGFFKRKEKLGNVINEKKKLENEEGDKKQVELKNVESDLVTLSTINHQINIYNAKTTNLDIRKPVMSSTEVLAESKQINETSETNIKGGDKENDESLKLNNKNVLQLKEISSNEVNANQTVDSSCAFFKELNEDLNCNKLSLEKSNVIEQNVLLSTNLDKHNVMQRNSNTRKRKLSQDTLIVNNMEFEHVTNKEEEFKNKKTVKKRKLLNMLEPKVFNTESASTMGGRKNNNQSIAEESNFNEIIPFKKTSTAISLTLNDKNDGFIDITKKLDEQNAEVDVEQSINSTITNTEKNVEEATEVNENIALRTPPNQNIINVDGSQNESVKAIDGAVRALPTSHRQDVIQTTDLTTKVDTMVSAGRESSLINDQELLDIKILQTDTTTQLDEEFLIEFDSIVNNQDHNCEQITKEIVPSKCHVKPKNSEMLQQTIHLPLCSENVKNADVISNSNILQLNDCKVGKVGNTRRNTVNGDPLSNHEIMDKISPPNCVRKRKTSFEDNSTLLIRDRVQSIQQAIKPPSKILHFEFSKKVEWNPNRSTKNLEYLSTNNTTTKVVSSSEETFDVSTTILDLDNEVLLQDLPEPMDTSIKSNASVDNSTENRSQPNTFEIVGHQIITSPQLITNNNIKQQISTQSKCLSEKEHKEFSRTVSGISSTISHKNKQLGTDSRGNKYVIIKTPAHNVKVHPTPNKVPSTLKAKISKINNLTSGAKNIVVFSRDDSTNILSAQKDKNDKLSDNVTYHQHKRDSFITKSKNDCNKEISSSLNKNVNETASCDKITQSSIANTPNRLNSDKSSFPVDNEVSFKAQQQFMQLQQQHTLQQSNKNKINGNSIKESQRKSRKFAQNKSSNSKSFTVEQKESKHLYQQQVVPDEVSENVLDDYSNKNVIQDAMQIEEPIDQTSKILAVPTQPIPGYNETFLLCTLVDNTYKPIDNVPLYLNHDLNQLVPVPLELLTDTPRLIVNHPISLNNEQSLSQNKSEIPSFEDATLSQCNKTEDDSNENTIVDVDGPLIVLPQHIIEEAVIDENSCELQPISDETVILESNENQIVPTNAIILNIEGQQIILDASTFAHLIANPDANTQLVTDAGTEFILTREVLAALQIQHDAQPVVAQGQERHQQQIPIQSNSHNLLSVGLEETNLYGTEILEIDTSQNLQLINTDNNITFHQTLPLTQPHLTPPMQANVSETNALLDQTPIMSTLESPSNVTVYRKNKITPLSASDDALTTSESIGSFCLNLHPNLEDSLAAIGVTTQSSTIPASLDLPITVTNPNIAPKVSSAPPIDMMQFAPPRSISAVATAAAVAAAALAGETRLFSDTAS